MSVGHVQRAVEESGIPTVSIFVRPFRHVAIEMALPRTVITRHPFGRPMGAAGDDPRHLEVTDAALTLVENATAGRSIVELEHDWRPGSLAPGSR